MSKYIRIRNESAPVDRRYFEKMGAGDKRNDNKTIGQFGSGSCFAPLAALRSGREYVVCAHDNSGPYRLSYISNHVDGIDEVSYDYGDEVKPSSFTLQAGELNWNEPWQIFREAMSNALDTHYRYRAKFEVSIVDEIDKPEYGYVDVYITGDPDMRDIVKNFDRYYTINREPIDTVGDTKIFESLTQSLRVYYKGVLVHHDSKVFSLYDYDVPHIDLNEERTIKRFYDFEYTLAHVLFNCTNEKIIRNIIRNRDELVIENKVDPYFPSWKDPSPVWKEVWIEMFGANAVLVGADTANRETMSSVNQKGHRGIVSKQNMLGVVLEKAGVKALNEILGEGTKFKDFDPIGQDKETLERAIKIVTFFEPLTSTFPVSVFEPNDDQYDMMGVALIKSGAIKISSKILYSLHKVVATLIHEVDHCITGANDLSREHRDAADERLANIMITSYSKENHEA